jgi:carbon storage regulator
MLVLSRKVDQTIVIQENITIKILEITGDRVKLGISAPRNVVILRQELTEEIKQENLDAVVGATPGGARPSIAALRKAPARP